MLSLKNVLALAGFLLATALAAGIGGIATAESVGSWYVTLNKPSWNPPGWVFGPAWTLLYLLMSVAAWRVWRVRDRPGARTTLALHGAQLVLNAGWSILFFGLRSPGLALIEIALLWSLLAVLQRAFWRLDRPAAWLWMPYLAWVSFATALNASIWWLNR
jgi:translocator protein